MEDSTPIYLYYSSLYTHTFCRANVSGKKITTGRQFPITLFSSEQGWLCRAGWVGQFSQTELSRSVNCPHHQPPIQWTHPISYRLSQPCREYTLQQLLCILSHSCQDQHFALKKLTSKLKCVSTQLWQVKVHLSPFYLLSTLFSQAFLLLNCHPDLKEREEGLVTRLYHQHVP